MDEERPPLTPEIWEEIAEQRYGIQKRHHNTLLGFIRDVPTIWTIPSDGIPLPPKRPIAVNRALADYAFDLFQIEVQYYPSKDPHTPYWKARLAERVEQMVVRHALKISIPPTNPMAVFSVFAKSGEGSIAYHISEAGMRKFIRTSLAQLAPISPVTATEMMKALPAPLEMQAIDAAVEDPLDENSIKDTTSQLKTLFDRTRITVSEAAKALDVNQSSIYKHLRGETVPRTSQLRAYEKLFSEATQELVRILTPQKDTKRHKKTNRS